MFDFIFKDLVWTICLVIVGAAGAAAVFLILLLGALVYYAQDF